MSGSRFRGPFVAVLGSSLVAFTNAVIRSTPPQRNLSHCTCREADQAQDRDDLPCRVPFPSEISQGSMDIDTASNCGQRSATAVDASQSQSCRLVLRCRFKGRASVLGTRPTPDQETSEPFRLPCFNTSFEPFGSLDGLVNAPSPPLASWTFNPETTNKGFNPST